MKHTYTQMMLHENDSGFLFVSLFLYFACLHEFLLIFEEGRSGGRETDMKWITWIIQTSPSNHLEKHL